MITKLEFLFRETVRFRNRVDRRQDAPGGHDGCDTRNNVLAQDFSDVVFTPGTRDCVVLSGAMTAPSSGDRIEFERSQATHPSQVRPDRPRVISSFVKESSSFCWLLCR